MNETEKRIIRLLENQPLSRPELVAKFPKKTRAKAGAALTSLIMSQKLGFADGKYFAAPKPSKMHNKRVKIDGITFDSIKEGERYEELKMLVRALKIKKLKCHPRYRVADGYPDFNGKRLPPISYEPDFEYYEGNQKVAEDVKGEHTANDPLYKLKRLLFLHRYPEIEFREIL
jgi:hypothetical protein